MLGVVSFSRLGALDDLSVDLSEQLRLAKEKADQQQKAAAAATAAAPVAAQRTGSQQQYQQQQPKRTAQGASPSYMYKDLPTKNEARRLVPAFLLSVEKGGELSGQQFT